MNLWDLVQARNVFVALADQSRREMLDYLVARPRSAGEIASKFPEISQPAVSRHLRVLREAELVSVRVDAQRRVYSLKSEGLRELGKWASKYELFWNDKLDALEDHLEGVHENKEELQRRRKRK